MLKGDDYENSQGMSRQSEDETGFTRYGKHDHYPLIDHSETILVNHNKLKSMNVNKSELCYVVCEKSMLFNSPQVRKLFKGNRYMYFVLNHFLYGMQNIDNLRLKYFWNVTICHKMSAKVTTGEIKIIWLCLNYNKCCFCPHVSGTNCHELADWLQ